MGVVVAIGLAYDGDVRLAGDPSPARLASIVGTVPDTLTGTTGGVGGVERTEYGASRAV